MIHVQGMNLEKLAAKVRKGKVCTENWNVLRKSHFPGPSGIAKLRAWANSQRIDAVMMDDGAYPETTISSVTFLSKAASDTGRKKIPSKRAKKIPLSIDEQLAMAVGRSRALKPKVRPLKLGRFLQGG